MAKMPTHLNTDDGWDTPTPEETAEAAETVLGDDDTPAGDEPEETGKEDDAAADEAKPKAASDKKAKADAADPAGGEARTDDDDDRVFEIDGKKYTADEVREWQLGYMRNRDYTQKRQRESAETRGDREILKALIDQNRELASALRASSGKAEGAEGSEGEPLDPRVLAAIDANKKAIEDVTQRMETREQERDQARQDEVITTAFERSVQAVCEKYGIPKEQRDLYFNYIMNQDPDIVDPETGRVTEQSIFRAVRREFLRHHGGIKKAVDTQVDGKIAGLKKAPANKPVAAKPPAKKNPNHGLLHKSKRERGWDSDANTTEYMERVNEALGMGSE